MSEYSEQCALFEWAERMQGRIPELALLYAIPNGARLPWVKDDKGRRFSPEAGRLLKSGLKPGLPDVALACARNQYHGLYIELKVGRNKTTDEQNWWLYHLDAQGYKAVVCRGWDAARETILEYLGVKEDA